MRGSIIKRSKGSWTIIINLGRDPTTGKRKQQWVTVRGTKKAAEEKLSGLLHELDIKTFVKPTKITVGEWLIRWLENHAWPTFAPRTAEGCEHIIRRHLIPGIGAVPLVDLNSQHLEDYYTAKRSHGRLDGKGGLSPRTVKHHHVTLHIALQGAIKKKLLKKNPADADNVDVPRYHPKEMQALDEDGLDRFLEAARETAYYSLFYLALYTGMRRSEMLALRWSDIDLDFAELSVVRSLHHLRDGRTIFRIPKTAKGRRTISLSPSTTMMLREHREAQILNSKLMGLTASEEALVFSTIDGSPLLPDTVTHAWVKLARRTGLKIRLHDARHTHASLMLKQNVRPKVVQERLGHATIATTLDIYSHVLPGMQEEAALQFDEGMVKARVEREIDPQGISGPRSG